MLPLSPCSTPEFVFGVKASLGGIPNPPLQVTPGSGEEELSVNASIKANIRESSAF